MDIKEMSLEALKALAYDQLALIEQSQSNLRLINEQIAIKSQEPQDKPSQAEENK